MIIVHKQKNKANILSEDYNPAAWFSATHVAIKEWSSSDDELKRSKGKTRVLNW